jgi:hypothetical protein
MAAVLQYLWGYIAPARAATNFNHGYRKNDLGVGQAEPLTISDRGTTRTPALDIKPTRGEMSDHVDRAWARSISVQNFASLSAPGAHLFFRVSTGAIGKGLRFISVTNPSAGNNRNEMMLLPWT